MRDLHQNINNQFKIKGIDPGWEWLSYLLRHLCRVVLRSLTKLGSSPETPLICWQNTKARFFSVFCLNYPNFYLFDLLKNHAVFISAYVGWIGLDWIGENGCSAEWKYSSRLWLWRELVRSVKLTWSEYVSILVRENCKNKTFSHLI